jgi:hypothetical protein
MPPTTSISLAGAFLALSDDGPPAEQRTLPRMVAATVAALVLAVGVPFGWYVAPRAGHPVAALASKTSPADSEE